MVTIAAFADVTPTTARQPAPAEATRRAYQSDWRIFAAWCQARGATALPAAPETVAAFLADQATAGIKPATIARRNSAIRFAHAAAGRKPPTRAEVVKATLRGIRRMHRAALARVAPVTADRVAAMIDAIPAGTLRGLRDRALILLGFAGAFRQAELAALRLQDLAELPDGLHVTDRRGTAAGREVAIPRGAHLRPVEALRAWITAAGIGDGPVFRRIAKSGRVTGDALAPEAVANIVKERAAAVGLAPEDFAGHGLRTGSTPKWMEPTRRRSADLPRGHARHAERLKDHADGAVL